MTQTNDFINVALGELGTKEEPAGSNLVKYNAWYYGNPKISAPWCCTFVSWCGSKVDSNLVGRFASCAQMANWFKMKKQWYTSAPRKGDIVFFKFGTQGNWTNHVGIITGVVGGTVYTVEGNTGTTNQNNGGEVMKKTRKNNIVGYGRPVYADSSEEKPQIKKGDINTFVGLAQTCLKNKGYNISIDCDFGVRTLDAVKKFQAAHGLIADGVIGKQTWAQLVK